MGHMKTITIRELHQATGRWVRRARAGEVYVTERGRLVAKIVPASPLPAKPFFANPKFTQAFLAQRKYLRGEDPGAKAVRKINFSTVFAGQAVGIKEVHDDIWLVSLWIMIWATSIWRLGCLNR